MVKNWHEAGIAATRLSISLGKKKNPCIFDVKNEIFFFKKLWSDATLNKQNTKQNTVILKKSAILYYSCFLEKPTVVRASKEVLDLTIRKGK